MKQAGKATSPRLPLLSMSYKLIDVNHIATLARLNLDDSEKTQLEKDLVKILEYINQLNQLNTKNVEPTSHILPIQNVFREDDINQEKLGDKNQLYQAPSKDKCHYEVPQII